MAEYASKIGDLLTAERCYKRAIDDAKNLGRIQDEMDCLLNMTINVYNVWGRYEEALSNFRSLRGYYNRVHDSRMQALLLNNIGLIHYRVGEYDIAMELYNQGLEISSQLRDDEEGISRALNNKALIHDKKVRI